jgi:hypothetical protein
VYGKVLGTNFEKILGCFGRFENIPEFWESILGMFRECLGKKIGEP